MIIIILSYYHAMEIIGPTTLETKPSNETWAAVKNICIRQYDLDYDKVRKEILEMRDDSIELSVVDIELCKKSPTLFLQNSLLDTVNPPTQKNALSLMLM